MSPIAILRQPVKTTNASQLTLQLYLPSKKHVPYIKKIFLPRFFLMENGELWKNLSRGADQVPGRQRLNNYDNDLRGNLASLSTTFKISRFRYTKD